MTSMNNFMPSEPSLYYLLLHDEKKHRMKPQHRLAHITEHKHQIKKDESFN